MGNELSWVWRQHWSSAAEADRAGGYDCFRRVATDAGKRPIVLFGASIGTAPALHIAAHRGVAGLILHNPPALRQLILGQYGWWNFGFWRGRWRRKFRRISTASPMRAPSMRQPFSCSRNEDEIVGSRYQRLVVDAYAGEKRIILLRGAYHNSPIEGGGLAHLYKGLDWLLPRNKE